MTHSITKIGLACLIVAASACAARAKGPNVVMIISDDQAWTDFGFMGHPVIRTPRLDKLASESAVFTRGYVPSSLCRASLATLVTGLFPHQHKITSNDPPKGTDRSKMLRHIAAHPTLPGLLGKQGYRSLQTGKWWEGNHRLGGFTHGMTHGDPKRRGRHGDEGLKIGRQGLQPIFDFIAESGDKPFFIWYAPFLPHTPHTPPERLLEKYAKPGVSPFIAKYYAMCEWFDETCGQLLDHLDEKGLRDDTLVVFVTDNGWIQQTDRRGYAPRSKRSPYDGGLRTPIMLRWPGKIQPQRDETTPVTSVDLGPTILRACGIEPTSDMQGINLLDVCAGKAPQRRGIFGDVFAHDAVDIDRPASSLLYRWGIEGPWKLILSKDKNAQVELFNLTKDPLEMKNLAAAEPNRVRQMTRRINAWWPGR